jgi:MFS family permease
VHRRNALLLGAATFCLWASLYIYVPVLPVHAQQLGASLPMVGLVIGAYGIAQLVLRLPLGLLSDRIGSRRPFVVAGLGAAALGALVMGYAPEPWTLLAGRTLSGVSAASWVIFTVLFAASFAPGASARSMSFISAITSLSQLVATGGGGLIAEAYGFRAPFLAGAALAALGIAIILPLAEPPRARRAARPTRASAGLILLVVTVLGALLVGVGQAAVYGYAPIYATSALGASTTQLGLLTTSQFLAVTVSALAMPSLAARMDARWAVLGGLAVTGAGILAIPLTRDLGAMAAVLAVLGLGRGAAYPLLMTLSIAGVPDESRAGSMAIFQAGYSVGMVSVPPLVGLLADTAGLPSVFFACGGLCLVAALLSLPARLWPSAAPAASLHAPRAAALSPALRPSGERE